MLVSVRRRTIPHMNMRGMHMSERGFYFVLVRQGLAKVFHESEYQTIVELENAGWQVVFDSARSEEHGFKYAAVLHRCLNLDYTDSHTPVIMGETKKLFRSVSLRELANIAQTGTISGKGNVFNEFEDRNLVFFCDSVSDSLIAQGEDVERQATVALADEAIHFEYARARAEKLDACEEFVRLVSKSACRADGERGTVGTLPEADLERARKGDILRIAQLARLVRGRNHELEALRKKIRAVDAEMESLRQRYTAMERDWVAEEMERREHYPFTSAIIETVPLSHGYHYSEAHGKSGMGAQDEYGFVPESVSVGDIARIHCIAEGKIVRKVDPDDLMVLASEVEDALRFDPPARPSMGA